MDINWLNRFILPRRFSEIRSLCLWTWCIFHSVIDAQLAALGHMTTYRQLFQLESQRDFAKAMQVVRGMKQLRHL